MNIESTIKKYAAHLSTPCFVYDYDHLEENEKELRKALPNSADLVYSIKANPNPAVIYSLQKMGVLFEVASEGELIHLLKIGIDTDKIIFSGQGKTVSGITRAIKNNVLAINIESMREWKIVSEISTKLKRKVSILLRINPLFDNKYAALKMGGISSPYGVDEEDIELFFSEHSQLCSIEGIFVYAGSNYHDYTDIVKNTRYIFELAERIYEKFGVKLKYLDFGGGFGVPEFLSDPELDLDSMGEELNSLFDEKLLLPCFSDIRKLFFESGRYLVATSGVLIMRALDIKISRGKKYVILDGGINCMGIKQFEYRRTEPELHLVTREHISNKNVSEVSLVGTTCTPIDLVHQGIALPKVSEGDFIYFNDCGAYTLEFSPKNFCGQVSPIEYMLKNDDLFITKEKGDIECPYGRVYTNLELFEEFLK